MTMLGTPDEYRKKLKPYIIESRKYHLQKLVDNKHSLEGKLAKVKARIIKNNEDVACVNVSLLKATPSDLEALHLAFFGEKGKCQGAIATLSCKEDLI